MGDDFAVFVAAGAWQNLTTVGDGPLRLCSVYEPAEHPHGTVHATREEADDAGAEHHG